MKLYLLSADAQNYLHRAGHFGPFGPSVQVELSEDAVATLLVDLPVWVDEHGQRRLALVARQRLGRFPEASDVVVGALGRVEVEVVATAVRQRDEKAKPNANGRSHRCRIPRAMLCLAANRRPNILSHA